MSIRRSLVALAGELAAQVDVAPEKGEPPILRLDRCCVRRIERWRVGLAGQLDGLKAGSTAIEDLPVGPAVGVGITGSTILVPRLFEFIASSDIDVIGLWR